MSSTIPASVHELLKLHNELRISQRLKTMTLEDRLIKCAQQYAEHLQRTGQFGHFVGSTPAERINRTGYKWDAYAENVAGYPTVQSTFGAWSNSSGHRANMLGPYEECGFGFAGEICVGVYASPVGSPSGGGSGGGTPGGGTPAPKPSIWDIIRRWLGW